ncbi:hypothetical protein DEU56DRAFT_400518 [Suillus clintonianus]|uniref:uncharacterized protein n=1 Tax=Suillus clintonianus TaxID=1904413 RepID=UPI001B8649AD|nr:uncharacterized protein DEU56DRAFT_400518 [Suillus clintonianus]KAG2135142.1 hypothetical protein DEU56DRAFT_400518 [Suillus clintonianus]
MFFIVGVGGIWFLAIGHANMDELHRRNPAYAHQRIPCTGELDSRLASCMSPVMQDRQFGCLKQIHGQLIRGPSRGKLNNLIPNHRLPNHRNLRQPWGRTS